MLNYYVVFLGSMSLENPPFIFELMLFYPHLLLAIAVPSIFMQILMTYSIRMLDKKNDVSSNDINCYNTFLVQMKQQNESFQGKNFLSDFQIKSCLLAILCKNGVLLGKAWHNPQVIFLKMGPHKTRGWRLRKSRSRSSSACCLRYSK